jgi:hypothetical membrane protein
MTTRFGAAAFILGPAQFLLANVIVQLGWRTPYSWADNNISDLGNVTCQLWGDDPTYVCSPLHLVMNTSAVVNGVLIIAGILLTGVLWRSDWRTQIARVLLVGAAGGFVLAGLFPADVNLNLHVLGAFLIMGVGNLGLLLAGLADRGSPLATLRVLTVSVVAVALVATWLHFSRSGPFGVGGSERFALFALQLWFIVLGGYLFRKARGTR